MVFQYQWWCPPEEYADVQDDWFIRFFERGCSDFDGLDSNNIEIYSVFGNWDRVRQHVNDDRMVRFLFVGENMTVPSQHPCVAEMDAILSFFEDTPKSIRFPLWMMYWRFDEEGLFPIPQGHRKDRAVIIVSHDNTQIRNMICQRVLCEYKIPVDTNLPSLSHTHIIDAPPRGVRHKMECISEYRYNICPENSYAHGYVTEKVFQSLAGGCIPIYWGPMPVEPSILKQDIILDVQGPFRPNLHVSDGTVWTDDAIVYMYTTYLKVWSIAYRKLSHDKCVSRTPSIPIVKYDCSTTEEAVDVLANHWKTYKRFWTPRPVFCVGSRHLSRIMEMEDLADMVYTKYRLSLS